MDTKVHIVIKIEWVQFAHLYKWKNESVNPNQTGFNNY